MTDLTELKAHGARMRQRLHFPVNLLGILEERVAVPVKSQLAMED
jgi:hypothetical protein